jgi:hypothetical protein
MVLAIVMRLGELQKYFNSSQFRIADSRVTVVDGVVGMRAKSSGRCCWRANFVYIFM